MVKPIDNHDLGEFAEIVFANSSAYVVELPMVGREAETAVLRGALEDAGNPRLVTISAPLGAGKTFFLESVFGGYSRAHPEFDERRDRKVLLATDVGTPNDIGDEVGPGLSDAQVDSQVDPSRLSEPGPGRKILVVEELDRKATLAQIRWSLEAGMRWLRADADRVLVVTGDAVITGSHVEGLLRDAPHRDHIALPPLDPALLKEAIRMRVLEKVLVPANPGTEPGDLAAAAGLAADQVLEDRYIQWSAVPPTQPAQLATFRDALGVLRIYAQNANRNPGSVRFDRKLIDLVPTTSGGLPREAAKAEAALEKRIASEILVGAPHTSMGVDELADLASTTAGPEFERGTLRLLVRKGLLTPVGIPYENRVVEPVAAPFVPSYRLLHTALIRLIRDGADK